MQFAIHTYGHFDAMFYVLNGIKMIMGHDFTDAMIKLMAMITTSYYALLGISSANSGRIGTYFLKTAGMLLIITGLLLPKADMLVVDRVSGKKEIVTNLPYAFVLPVGILEAFGAGITSLFEQAFATISSTPHKDYGMIFGQRIVQESKNWRIANPEFSRNMDAFLERCVVLEAQIGSRFTPEEVIASIDMFKLATENAGTFRKVDFRIEKVPTRLTCKESGGALKKYIKQEMGFLSFKYRKSDFAIAGRGDSIRADTGADEERLNLLLARNLELGYTNTLGVEGKAEDIIRQNMMINSLKGFNNKSDLYGYTRASGIQNSNWSISGELAKEYLPLLLNIIKALIYTSFIFIVPLMILGGGMNKYLKYCVVVFSLQIWPALNSVLNLFIEIYSHVKGSSISGGAITYGNFNQAHEAVDTIVYVASGLQMSIPFLSFAIVQGGVQSFVHLAGSVQSASNGAASVASNELSSGSRGFDNITKGSESIDQKSGFKTDWNQSHQEGAKQVQGASGEMFRTFADGSSAINSGTGMNLSSGSRSFNLSGSQDTSLQQSLGNTLSSLQSDEQSFNKSKTSTISNVGDLVSHIAQRESKGDTFSYDSMGEQGKALQQAVNHTKEVHEQGGHSWEQAAKAGLKTSISGGFGMPSISPIKGDISVGADASVDATNASSQSLTEDQRVAQSNDSNKIFNNLVKASTNEQWMTDNSVDNSYAQSTKASYDEMQSYGQSVAQKREEANTYSEALQHNKSNGASDHRDMYHEVEQGVMKQYGVSQNQAHQMIESNDPRANKVWDGMVQQNIGNTISQVRAGRNHVNNSAAQDANSFHNEHQGKVNNDGLQNLQTKAAEQGLNKKTMQEDIAERKQNLQTKYDDVTNENSVQYQSVLHANNALKQGLQQRVDKYDEDRIGQGKVVAPVVGFLAQIPTVGNAGAWNVGGPNAAERAELNSGGNASQLPPVIINKNEGGKK
ncbi:MAG: conjugal transfer protein TraG N-terminal domain-containing protein [Rickettsiaceae bacterium]|nr:conjugal transfer protein TraG N-terminal domain-containing protein [Rickettsiaceae bacterium]